MKFSHHIIIGQTLTDLQGKLDSILAAHPQQQVVFKRYFLPDESLRQQFPAEKGAVSYIIQPVLCEGSVALWLVLCEGAAVRYQGCETLLEGEGIRLIITASLTCPEGTSEQQTRSIFSAYAALLEARGLTLEGNCVRTWLFCDDIDHQYAGLVKARREFFAACGLTPQTHFIASTGIAGRPAGAGTPEGAYSLVSANEGVPAPAAARAAETAPAAARAAETAPAAEHTAIVQMDALAMEGAFTQRYLYARTHLSPTYDYGVTFERGVRIDAGGHHATLISGTASIDHKGNILHEGDVPGAGEQGTHRETGAVIGIAVTLTGRLDAQAGRAVGEDGAGDAEALDRTGVAGGAGNLPGGTGGDAVHHGGTGAANEQGGFLLQGHRLDDFFDVVLGQFRLGQGSERHDERCNGQ